MRIKRILISIWNEFIYGGHLLSIGAAGIVCLVMILLEKWPDWQILLIAYLISQIVYSHDHFKKLEIDLITNLERVRHLQKFIKYFPLIFLSYIIVLLILLFFFANIKTFFFILFLMIGGILFTTYFKRLTKKISGFKSFYTTIFWTTGIFLPLFYYSFFPNLFFILLILFFFYLRFFIGTSFSDIKDMEVDTKEGLLTLAVVLGKEKLINLLKCLNLLTAIPIIIGVHYNFFPVYSLMLVFSIPYSFYYLKKAEEKNVNTAFLYNVIVDGEIIVWLFFIIIGKALL